MSGGGHKEGLGWMDLICVGHGGKGSRPSSSHGQSTDTGGGEVARHVRYLGPRIPDGAVYPQGMM